MPLSLTSITGRNPTRSRKVCSMSVVVAWSRLLMPTRSAPEASTLGKFTGSETRRAPPCPARSFQQRRHHRVIKNLGDQKNGVGTGEPGLTTWYSSIRKSCAARESSPKPALEPGGKGGPGKRNVGQYADASRPVSGRSGDGDRTKIVKDHFGRGAGLLDLSDELNGASPAKAARKSRTGGASAAWASSPRTASAAAAATSGA